MHAATPRVITKNATIFWEHEVFVVDCCQQNGNLYFFCIFLKKCENNGKNNSFNLSFIDNFFYFAHPCVYYA